jgi:hypothetical protein
MSMTRRVRQGPTILHRSRINWGDFGRIDRVVGERSEKEGLYERSWLILQARFSIEVWVIFIDWGLLRNATSKSPFPAVVDEGLLQKLKSIGRVNVDTMSE